MKTFQLNNKSKIPVIGLGTYPMNNLELIKVIRKSVKLGYRSFDTATAYSNERFVGYGIKFSGVKRKELFISTKLSNAQQRSGEIESALKDSLKRLKLDYVDLYLMHWPNPETYIESWIKMEKLYKKGLAKAIGVCNFHKHHLEKLLEVASVIPAVNQIEVHPLLNQDELVSYCKSKGILVEAYTPLARMDNRLVSNETLIQIARKYDKKISQIVLRWDYQRGIVTIPKSNKVERLKDNINIFDFSLTEEEMIAINNVNINLRLRHNPDNCDFTKL
ncbi:2%2C5-didehydrogluconate reductase [Clostridium paraputrificum]|uniref:aldo/keto reductase n=1 Tax=Clostridium paraputrificum TaxID=29363 RepID=UPI0006C0CD6E|nr:aldo/keto reductase [Clostridium paraputrificum]CUQ42692.1 2%2C5-didehydrogluconate reductase [Clostridium paraputrificum]